MRPIPIRVLQFPVLLTVVLVPLASTRGQDARPKDANRPATAGEPADPVLDDLLAVHNTARAAEKRPPLKASARLTRSARAHAADMAKHSHLTHDGSDGSDPVKRIKRTGYHYKEVAENVAAGQDTAAGAMRSWLDSPPHRENILRDFTEMGGAMAIGPDGKSYWCVDFGLPMPEVDPEKSPAAIIDELNRARSKAGKRTLKTDPQLARTAARFAREAAARRSLDGKDHEGNTPFEVLERDGFRTRRFGMTMASGEGEPSNVVASWLKDDREKSALLSGFERAGVGVATDADGVPYWVLLLAQGVTKR